ncbi:winged helix-turn-helix domain-containing protein [Devosia sp. XJ19-1]|uniref:Winged helix-turn-helix domain-containing protein n=1 Tax=Devosia ureilytica TaxID=2952754 RepID=A0A9Q4ALF5_9HYPH|nr:winged helix-turn-helix domain-containing protein [Devosia ureilytica]MCP8882347.1 winged helix-turn-helix domain-containing protein [Devosia ureilytica]MCP8885766.1 winged helix-turn-helix domain-containing protein [Devosia ureilytica]
MAIDTPHGDPEPAEVFNDQVFHFGDFRLDVARHLLFRGDQHLRLGSRAMSILVFLLERPGELVTKEHLVRVAWPETFVEDINLRVHMSALRRALGDRSSNPRYIANVVGRGYRFIAPVNASPSRSRADAQPHRPSRPRQFIGKSNALIGRDAALEAITTLAESHRLVTLTGPPGVGKTALASVAAGRLAQRLEVGAVQIDLCGQLADDQIAGRLFEGLELPQGLPLAQLGAHIGTTGMLVILDGCEAGIEAAARVAETLMVTCPGIRVLATSREALRASNERVYHVAPLDLPTDETRTLGDVMRCPSTRMLVERVQAGGIPTGFSDRDVPRLIAICRKLGGFPVAIEMAASSIQVFGLKEVDARLVAGVDFLVDDRRSSTGGRRAFREVIEQDIDGLQPQECRLLEALSVFAGAFSLREATKLAQAQPARHTVIALLGALVAKSQLLLARTGGKVAYRMPMPFRAVAYERLRGSPAWPRIASEHAQIVLDQLREALAHWRGISRSGWLERHSELALELSGALAWCLSEGGDLRLGAQLITEGLPVLLRACRCEDAIRFARLALDVPGAMTPKQRMSLLLHLARSEQNPEGLFATDARRHLLESGALRRQIATPQATAEWALAAATVSLRSGRLERARKLAKVAADLTSGPDVADLIYTAQRLLAEVHHYQGDQRGSMLHAQRALARYAPGAEQATPMLASPSSGALRIVAAKQLWLRGKANQARAVMFEALTFAAEDGPEALCEALALGACPLLLWCGDDERAALHIGRLEREAEFSALTHWLSWASLYRKVIAHISMREGRRSEGSVAFLPTSLLQAETWVTLTSSTRGASLPLHLTSGWCRAEILRAEALTRLNNGQDDEAVAQLRLALSHANEQGELAWELRAAMSLARFWRHERSKEAYDLLRGLFDRFEEGHDTSDLLAAKVLLKQLRAD